VKRASVLALIATLLVALPALAARPAPNARLSGKTSQDRKLVARVTSDSTGLQLEFDEVFRCNRGPRKNTRAVYNRQRPSIREDGTFDYRKTYRDLPPAPGFEERRTERQHVSGSFTADGARVRGRAVTSITGRSGLRCTATVTFTARKTRCGR